MGWPNYQSETQIYAKYILKNSPRQDRRDVAQNDDYGKITSRAGRPGATRRLR